MTARTTHSNFVHWSPHPCRLRPVNPTTSHNNKNNNDGGLHAFVYAADGIEPIMVTRAKYFAPLPLCWAKKDYGQLTSHFHFLLHVVFSFSSNCLFVYTAQDSCACSVSSSPFLVNFKHHWNMNYSVLSCFQLIHLDANILETMPRLVLPLWKCQLSLRTRHCCSLPLLVCVCEAAVCVCRLCVNWNCLWLAYEDLLYLGQSSSLMQLSRPSLLPPVAESRVGWQQLQWVASVCNVPHLIVVTVMML